MKKVLIGLVIIEVLVLAYFAWMKMAGDPVSLVVENPAVVSAGQFFSQNLKTFVDDKTGITFQYPEKILTNYISTIVWPPKASEKQEPFVCNEGGTEISQAGQTVKQSINGHDYCVTKESEGAAGSVYTNYAYAFPYNNTTIILTFTLRAVQCDNYDESKKSECKQERELFDPDQMADQMAQSLTFKIQE